jgi:hypothetical protein
MASSESLSRPQPLQAAFEQDHIGGLQRHLGAAAERDTDLDAAGAGDGLDGRLGVAREQEHLAPASDPTVVRQILDHLRVRSSPLPRAPPHDPSWEGNGRG